MRALQQRGGLQDIAAWVQFARVKLVCERGGGLPWKPPGVRTGA